MLGFDYYFVCCVIAVIVIADVGVCDAIGVVRVADAYDGADIFIVVGGIAVVVGDVVAICGGCVAVGDGCVDVAPVATYIVGDVV